MECPTGTFRSHQMSEEVCKPCGDKATSDENDEGRWCCMFSTKMKMLCCLLCWYIKLGMLLEIVVRETEVTNSLSIVILNNELFDVNVATYNEMFNVNVATFL